MVRGGRATSTEDFWQLLSLTEGRVDGDALEPLARALGRLSARRMTDFGEHFRSALSALDAPVYRDQPVRDVDDPVGAAPLPMSDDVFLYTRCAVVGAGHDAWQKVMADPSALAARPWQMANGELLLALVEEAYDDRTGERFELEPSGVENPHWLNTGYGLDMHVPDPPASRWACLAFWEALNTDPVWRAWWAESGRVELWLFPFVTSDPTEAMRVKCRSRTVEVHGELDSAWRHGEDRQQLADAALREIKEMIELAATNLRLATHPAWPEIGPVPDDLSESDNDHDEEDVLGDVAALSEMYLKHGGTPEDLAAFLAELDAQKR
jgi:hypothetical protein